MYLGDFKAAGAKGKDAKFEAARRSRRLRPVLEVLAVLASPSPW